MGSQVRPNIKSGLYHRMPVRLDGRFTLSGAANPTVVGGCVQSVLRLATATPTNFFRIALPENWNLANRNTVIVVSARATTDVQDVTAHAIAGNLVDAGGNVFNPQRNIDIVVRVAGAAVTTAGLVVDISIALDQVA